MASSNLMLVTSMLPKVLYSGQLAGTGDVVLYAAPSPGSALVKHGVACNTSGSSVLLTLRVVPSGGSVDGTHIALAYSLPANENFPLADFLGGCCLGPGDAIHAQAATGAAVDVVITGVENT